MGRAVSDRTYPTAEGPELAWTNGSFGGPAAAVRQNSLPALRWRISTTAGSAPTAASQRDRGHHRAECTSHYGYQCATRNEKCPVTLCVSAPTACQSTSYAPGGSGVEMGTMS